MSDDAPNMLDALSEGDGAVEFFREMVEPTVAEFLDRPDDRRLGCLACLCLASMADHYFHARPRMRDERADPNGFRRKIGESHWAVRQVIGVANATKHVVRLTGRVGYQDISAQPITCANLRAGWPINGNQEMVEVEGGELWLLADLVEAALEFWRDRLAEV
ncbi:hypothetical protein FHW79_001687 [Azospirillum sp. OGB3]|uniref:hypothetical protein n=1 Tax=Azospirillum sp. OGB3 TaxID=2587012 RepID=UPI0016065B2D|nr:hypothetical protein [Azospirillum sp. OGB3]MBB3264072.1 hypothetical protein [Azospirillum sp. OGB3]